MRIPTWRLVLAAGAVVILVAAGIGLVAAANAPANAASALGQAAPTGVPAGTADPDRGRARARLGDRPALAARLLRIGRHLVHVEATVTDRDGKLVVVWLDHGTVQSVGSGSVTISETGGGTQTIKTDDATLVRVGRDDGTLNDVAAGAEVFVMSRIDGGSPLAKRIRIIPAQPSAPQPS